MAPLAPLPRALKPADPSVLIATVLHAGRLTPAPGTWASAIAAAAAVPIVVFAGPLALAIALLAVVQLGIWASGRVIRASQAEDPPIVVIDEVAGQWLALLAAPLDPLAWLAAFALFRLFDIVKPFPANWADARLSGGVGAMADDLIAGLYAALWVLVLDWLGAW